MVRDQTERSENDEVRYPSLRNRRRSLDEASNADQDGLRALIELAEKVVDDPSALPAFMALVNANQTHAAAFIITLAAAYEEEKARRLEKEAEYREVLQEKETWEERYQDLDGGTSIELEALKDRLRDKEEIIQNLRDKIATTPRPQVQVESPSGTPTERESPPQRQVPLEATPSPSIVLGPKTEKLPHPEIFEDGPPQKFRSWLSAMKMKFMVNAALFPTELSKVAYVQSRTGGDARELLGSYFEDFERAQISEMFTDLANRFDSPFRQETARREYHYLRQKQQDLAAFLGDFRRLSREAEVREEDQIVDLRDKVRDDLKQVIILRRYATIQEMITDLTYADMNSRRIASNKSTVGASTPSKSSAPNSRQPAGESVTKEEKPVAKPRFQRDVSTIRCYRCEKMGHYVKDCPQTREQSGKELPATKTS
jgi:Zinc knuckle